MIGIIGIGSIEKVHILMGYIGPYHPIKYLRILNGY